MAQTTTTELIPTNLKREAELHIEKVRAEMRKNGVDSLLVAGNTNVYYLTLRFFRGFVWVPVQGDVKYFVMRPIDMVGDNVIYIRKPEQIAGLLAEECVSVGGKLGLEFGELSYSEVERLKNCFPDAEAVDSTLLLKRARMVKTPWEISQIRTDGMLQAQAYREIPKMYRLGMTDVELQIAIENTLRMKGNLGYSRKNGRLMEINLGSVIAGNNADVPSPYEFAMGGAGVDPSQPSGADGREILVGTTIMVDMNGCFNGYQSDMTRVWSLGEIPELARKAHECSLEILRNLEVTGYPGFEISKMCAIADEIVKEAGLEDYFMGHRQKVGFIGHGVGIELNELPVIMSRSKDVLEEGMVIALEPKFVIPEVGAVGAENTYVVTKVGLSSLTIFPEKIENLL